MRVLTCDMGYNNRRCAENSNATNCIYTAIRSIRSRQPLRSDTTYREQLRRLSSRCSLSTFGAMSTPLRDSWESSWFSSAPSATPTSSSVRETPRCSRPSRRPCRQIGNRFIEWNSREMDRLRRRGRRRKRRSGL